MEERILYILKMEFCQRRPISSSGIRIVSDNLWFKVHVMFQRATENYTVIFGKETKNGQR